jgi:hypothetical protein
MIYVKKKKLRKQVFDGYLVASEQDGRGESGEKATI